MKEFNLASYEVLNDPLSSASRGAKKGVMTFSVASIVLSLAKFNGDGFNLLGLKFDGVSQMQIYAAIASILLYMLVNFLVHLSADVRRYKYLFNVLKFEHAKLVEEATHTTSSDQEQLDFWQSEFRSMTGFKSYDFNLKDISRLVWARFVLDFILPLVLGSVALFLIMEKLT